MLTCLKLIPRNALKIIISWYDLDFLYLEQHPGFRAFSLYENAVDFDNEFIDLFSKDAFENRRQYICGFYHSDNHGELHREYKYLTPEQADSFVMTTTKLIMESERVFFEKYKSRENC